MYKSNILALILIINIFIFSVHSYILERYDYGEFQEIARGSEITKGFQVTKDELLNFKLKREIGDSPGLFLNITSNDVPENIILYSTFEDEIASESNSNPKTTITPFSYSLCMPDFFFFSIQMDNSFLGGDLSFLIQSNSNPCTAPPSTTDEPSTDSPSPTDEPSSSTDSPSSSTDSPSSSTDSIDEEDDLSGASASFVNGVLIYSMVILLSLQLIV